MVRTHKKMKKTKFLASRHNGRGNKKKGRGSGTRGGVGRGGAWKHKKTYTLKFERDSIGRSGFVNKARARLDVINLTEISRLIEGGKVGKKDNVYYFKFDGKVLGAGRLLYPAVVEARAFSKSAVDKIEQAGGETKQFEVEKNGS
ncbi:MAG: uL15m family ribosomal protein [Candidatus Micrarchaeia archaeon]